MRVLFRLLSVVLAVATVIAGAARAASGDEIDRLAAAIQGRSPGQVRALIVQRFGPPARDIGSGVRIEQWDVAGGVLTFHPLSGPTFAKSGSVRTLIRTTNPLDLCLFGDYEMTTLPDPANRGTLYWLGNLSLTRDGRYRFTDSGQNLKYRTGQKQNYFLRHPEGSARVEYPAGVTPQTLLESLKDGRRVAILTFTARDNSASARYPIVVDVGARRLRFAGTGTMTFRMDKGWVNFWR